LRDDSIRNRDFVRMSLVEVTGSLIYGVDELDTLPQWFVENSSLIYKKARCAYNERKENKDCSVDNIQEW
jgi:hypothetical protein